MKNTTEKYRRILERLSQLRTRLKLTDLAAGIVFSLGFVLLITGAVLLLEIIFNFAPSGRIFLVGLVLLSGGGLLLWFLLYPLALLFGRRFSPTAEKLALRVGDKFPHIKDHLSNALQLYTQLEQDSKGYSKELTIAALEDVGESVEPIDFNTVVDYSKLKRNLRFSGIIVAGFLILIPLFSKQFSLAAMRLWHPTASFSEITPYTFDIQPGNLQIIKGGDVTITANIKSEEYLENANLSITSLSSGRTNEWYLHAGNNGQFKYTVSNVTDSLRYQISVNEQTSSVFKISIIEVPLVRNLQLKLDYPNYTRLPSRFLDENVGDISAIKGTKVSLVLKSSKNLDSATVEFGTGQRQVLAINALEATGTFFLKQSTNYLLHLTDRQGLKNDDPIQYQIDALEDHYPSVKITAPANDVDVTGDMRLIIMGEAEDDFGFSNARLHYRVNRQKSVTSDKDRFFSVPIKNPHSEKIALDFEWELRELNLQPSDWVEYYLEIFDNDVISGPKSARSLSYTLRYPSMNEMYEEVAVQQEQTDENLESVLEQSQELREKIDEIVEEMKKDPQISWEEKKNIEEALDSQKKLTAES